MIAIGQEFPRGGEDIHALSGRATLAMARTLIGHFAEKIAFRILAAALIPIVGSHGNKLGLGKSNDIGIGEGEHTAHDAIVSGAAQGMAVHFPKKDRFALRGRLSPRFSKAGEPGNLQIFFFFLSWFYQGMEIGELGWSDRFIPDNWGPEKYKAGQEGNENFHGIDPWEYQRR